MMDIDWSMSAALANVERGGSELPEVTSLEGAVRAWMALDNGLQNEAVLRPEHGVTIDGETVEAFEGQRSGRWRIGCCSVLARRRPAPFFRHPGLVPGSTVPQRQRLPSVRRGGCRNKSGVTEGVSQRSR
ncbi:MAG: hypothetical protein PGN08_12435 [Sphingomonas taxi]